MDPLHNVEVFPLVLMEKQITGEANDLYPGEALTTVADG